MHHALLATTVVAIMFTTACSGGSVPVTQVYTSEQCPRNERGLHLIVSDAELVKVLTPRLNPTRIELSREGHTGPSIPHVEVNFDESYAVLVARGQMPTPGYGVSLTATEAPVENGVVRLPVEFSKPDPDAFYAQVITTPCLILSIPKNNYAKITAGDMEVEVADQ